MGRMKELFIEEQENIAALEALYIMEEDDQLMRELYKETEIKISYGKRKRSVQRTEIRVKTPRFIKEIKRTSSVY